ncbi:metallophosphoesterase [Bacteroides sp. 51]|uniref:metallophosphoesterase family protein n=1 Tax=Bacteroides sp. 51 TaxID=2302938 RepID=UPI0013D6F03D|nr:metallophosphoesterase [Bacteroides sp. 51]NDV80852.1 phosphoesterase [Bacteroides sp. 51]
MKKNSYPCILMLNDIHVSKDNIPEFEVNWREALTVCMEENIRQIALGGDLFLSRSSQTLDVLLAVYDAFVAASRFGIQIAIINGNHDKVNQEENRGYCHVFDQHINVIVADTFITLRDDLWDFSLHLLAYFPENGSFQQKLDELIAENLDKGKRNFLYIHEGINGALAHPSENELPTHIFDVFDQVFVGHYHNRSQIVDTNILYIGSSRQHNFGEDEEKGYTILYSDGNTRFVKNKANIRYKVIDVADDKMGVHLTDLLDELKSEGQYKIKVRVHSNTARSRNIDKSTLIRAGANKVEVITEDVEAIENVSTTLFEKFDHGKICENYQEFCKEKKIDNVELGLSYLLKIDTYVESN